MLPTELEHSKPTPASLKLRLFLDPKLFWFKGHFPSEPILPGVAQIHWVNHYARHYLNLTGQFSAMQAIKFQSPASEGETLELNLQWQAEKNLLVFSYHSSNPSAELQAISSGKIRFVS